jgi:AcrR family transcriptional regulator
LTTARGTPRRSDARRNRQRLLAAADAAFRSGGVNASLEGIAKAAGVAIGTLYAHFRTRDDLLAALLADRIDRLAVHGRQLLKTQPPQRALFDWLDAFGSEAATYHGLPDSVIRTLHDPDSGLSDTCELMRRTCAKLLRRTQRAGEVRSDIGADDLLAMTAAVSGMAKLRGRDIGPFMSILTAGLTPPTALRQ